MSTPQTVIAQLNKLLTDANATTGQIDTTLTDAVASLIAGFGQGGGTSGLTYTTGSWVQATSVRAPGNIAHGLGVTPRIFMWWADISADELPLDLTDISDTAITSAGCLILNINDGVFSVPQRLTAAISRPDGLVVLIMGINKGNTVLTVSTPTSMAYGIESNENGDTLNEVVVKLKPTGSAAYLIAGRTYKWLAIA